ncbi:ras guanine nucleotide exchange factor domain-containing protein [Schizophyllum commune]
MLTPVPLVAHPRFLLPPTMRRPQFSGLRVDVHPFAIGAATASPPTSATSSSSSGELSHPSRPTSTAPSTPPAPAIDLDVLCLYDFASDDPDHLSFRKNEILSIVKQLETGWWAAVRADSDASKVGWIPASYVAPLSRQMSHRLRAVRAEIRVYEYEAERLYDSAPIQRNEVFYEPSPPPSRPASCMGARQRNLSSPDICTSVRPMDIQSPSTPVAQPSPLSSVQEPVAACTPLRRSESTPTQRVRRSDVGSISRINKLVSEGTPASATVRSRSHSKIKQITGSEEACLTYRAQADTPAYLRPRYADEIRLEPDGSVRCGTLRALVERLTFDTQTRDPIKLEQERRFRTVFFTTFRTFTTADDLFRMLAARYYMEPPVEYATHAAAIHDWTQKLLLPTQGRVLTVLTIWLEDHRLLEEEPHIAGRLTDLLSTITTQPHVWTARLMLQSLERLTFARPPTRTTAPPQRWRRKSRDHRGDLLRLEPADVAAQLAAHEYELYSRVTPDACFTFARGKPAPELSAFCATHDAVAALVKRSTLACDTAARRANAIDFWIKVAEKSRGLHNLSALSAIASALSSVVIARLSETWSRVTRRAQLDQLVRLNDPAGRFAAYRALAADAAANNVPCVPFAGTHLTELVHIADAYSDGADCEADTAPALPKSPSPGSPKPATPTSTIAAPPSPRPSPSSSPPATQGAAVHEAADATRRICFLQRARWHDVVRVLLVHQRSGYEVAEDEAVRTLLLQRLREASEMGADAPWFWERSQELQQGKDGKEEPFARSARSAEIRPCVGA